jgi:hypothetical protein
MPAIEERPRRYTVRMKDGTIVGRAELRPVLLAAIKKDFAYQRGTNPSWISRNLPFNPQLAGAVILSSRLGGPFVIDGGHRTDLALATPGGPIEINAFVIDGLTQRDEARLFVLYQRERTNLNSFQLYRADLVRGDAETTAIVGIINRAGFRLPPPDGARNAGGAYTITAIDAVRKIWHQGGPDVLAETLELVKHSQWIGLEKALNAQVLKGLALFLQSFQRDAAFRPGRLDAVMKNIGPSKLLLQAQEVSGRDRHSIKVTDATVAEALMGFYNAGQPEELRLPVLKIGRKKRPAPAKGFMKTARADA